MIRSFETEIDSEIIIEEKLPDFIKLLKTEGALSDNDIEYIDETAFFEGVTVMIEFGFDPGCKGQTDGKYGPPIEPDEPAHIYEIFTFIGKNKIDITDYIDNAEDKFSSECWDWVNGLYE